MLRLPPKQDCLQLLHHLNSNEINQISLCKQECNLCWESQRSLGGSEAPVTLKRLQGGVTELEGNQVVPPTIGTKQG